MSLLNKLPANAKKLYESVYSKAKSEGKSSSDASSIALKAVKDKYKTRVITKSTALKITILKSGFFNKTIKFRIPLTDTKVDSEGQRVSSDLINKLYTNKLIKQIGDIEHETIAKRDGKTELRNQLTKLTNTRGLYLLEDITKTDDDELEALVVMNKTHPLYETMLKEHKSGNYLYASAEFNDAKLSNDESEIIDASSLGWTITNSPINHNMKVRSAMAC